MSFVYANSGSGPSAGGIGWFNFGNLTLAPGDSITGLTGTLSNGSTVTFDASLANISGASRTLTASPTPTWGGTFFGTSNYTGIVGNVAMQTNFVFAPGSNTLTLSNIVVKDSIGNLIPNYTAIVADAESTGMSEIWNFTTNGSDWKLFTTLGNSTDPTLTGLGTPTVSFVGNAPVDHNDFVFSTLNPTTLNLNTNSTNTGGGNQAIAIGFAVNRVRLVKNIGQRIDSNDQFVLNIAGTPNTQVTTVGSADGIQPQVASVYTIPGNTYTVTEAMAVGSASLLTDYTTVVSATNITPGGTTPTTGNLPLSINTALGDDVVYIVLNSAPETFEKTVDKAYANTGEVVTYTITIRNPNNYAINNISVIDATPIGSTYVGNIISNVPYTGTTLASGLTLSTINADSFAKVSWQVQVNSSGPIVTPITNVASISIPGGRSGSTNLVSTDVNHADLTSAGNFTKSVDKAYANFGDVLTYTLSIKNTGNAPANNVVITDILPLGTTYVAGSVASSVSFSGTPDSTINITAPIPAGGTVTISYKALLVNGVPPVNPVLNNAKIDYAYTVDPSQPNGATASGISNTTSTFVASAKLKIVKSVDTNVSYIGQVLTYTFAVTNTGNTDANNVVLTDNIPLGTAYVPGSLTVNAPYIGASPASIALTTPLTAGSTVAISFKVTVTQMPAINPLLNKGDATFNFTLDPSRPNLQSGSSASNTVSTLIFRNNYSQQISDLIQSVALEEAALAAIVNAEGAKIQKIVAMNTATTQQLLCLNKSVSDMNDSLATLTAILRQKLAIVNCQINGIDC